MLPQCFWLSTLAGDVSDMSAYRGKLKLIAGKSSDGLRISDRIASTLDRKLPGGVKSLSGAQRLLARFSHGSAGVLA